MYTHRGEGKGGVGGGTSRSNGQRRWRSKSMRGIRLSGISFVSGRGHYYASSWLVSVEVVAVVVHEEGLGGRLEGRWGMGRGGGVGGRVRRVDT